MRLVYIIPKNVYITTEKKEILTFMNKICYNMPKYWKECSLPADRGCDPKLQNDKFSGEKTAVSANFLEAARYNENRGETEYLKAIPNGDENDNLGNLPSVSPKE